MAGGGFAAPAGAHKIKGGRWTVFRFFLVSTAFTSAWVAVSSQLGYYRKLHGPAVLLQLNIAYFLPSIPLLVVSAFLDKPLEARLGVAKTILIRLLVGLVGYGTVTAWFPFMPERIWFLLGAVVALGLFSGIAFSASYQLVARFANKNVIALGLGCSASGPLVLALQLGLRMGPTPTRHQQILLYETIAVVIVGGLWATSSLLLRHWSSIEQAASGKQELTEPLLQAEEPEMDAAGGPVTPPDAAAAAAEAGAAGGGDFSFRPAPPSPQPEQPAQPSNLLAFGNSLWKQRSLPPLVAYSSLEPYQSPFLSTEQEVAESEFPSSWGTADGLLGGAASDEEANWGMNRGRELDRAQHRGERQLSAPPAVLLEAAAPEQQALGEAAHAGVDPDLPAKGAAGYHAPAGVFDTQAAEPQEQLITAQRDGVPAEVGAVGAAEGGGAAGGGASAAGGGASASWQAVRLIWAPLAALSLSSTIALTLFPFFTYTPTSGLLGDNLPKVLFYVRIFADVLGRFLPRLRPFAARSPLTPLVAACTKLAGVPLFLLYLKSPDRFHSDVAAVVFIVFIWLLGGYVNTMSNMLAPRLVPAHLKGAAAGAMAIAYQAAHFLGLSIATLLVYLLFGRIGVE